MFLILTKIFSKSEKSDHELWNLCINWFMHKFSILEMRISGIIIKFINIINIAEPLEGS